MSKYATLPFDVYRCARHDTQRKDADLRAFYYCDDCVREVGEGALRSAAPAYEGPPIDGHCALCNERRTDIRLRQWHLCTTCDRVVRSIGRGRVAARFVSDWWRSNIEPVAPHLRLTETDPPVLRPYGTATKSKSEAHADFVAMEVDSGDEALTLELKTGRSNLRNMSRFQLDVTDCDDILSVVRAKLIPGYVLHAMVVEQVDPPTSHFEAVAMWWTDVFQMTDAFSNLRQRQTEQRPAAYFKKTCFHPMSEFVEAIRNGHPAELAARLRSEGVPPMYRLD